jgi:hypothetical protein
MEFSNGLHQRYSGVCGGGGHMVNISLGENKWGATEAGNKKY